jgi:hypothetical protein
MSVGRDKQSFKIKNHIIIMSNCYLNNLASRAIELKVYGNIKFFFTKCKF